MNLSILLCAGTGRFSRIIQRTNKIAGYKGEAGEISHVAMLVKVGAKEGAFPKWRKTYIDRTHGLLLHEGVYAFESTTINKWADKSGVQINEFNQWCDNYKGKVWRRDIACELPDGMLDWMAGQVGRPYENGLGGLIELATCYIPISLFKGRTVEAHCSEIDAECLQQFGLMSDEANPSKLPPCMWFGGIDGLMNCRVEKPVRIK